MTEEVQARELELEYRSFLDDEARDGVYKTKVEDMIKNQETRLAVKINDIRRDPNFVDRAKALVSKESATELVAFQRALKEFVISLDPTYGRSQFEFRIGLYGSFGSRHVTPRTLQENLAVFQNNTICIEGIVSKLSSIKPRLVRSVHYCPATKKTIERRHYDTTSLDYVATSGAMESKDEDGNPLELEVGLSLYKNHQTATIQEMPENAPPGQAPRHIEVILQNDLVDSCKPGDRLQVVGTFQCLPHKKNGFSNCVFPTVVIANHVQMLSKEVDMTLTEDDIVACTRLSKTRRIKLFDTLARSIAPSIKGHEHVKKAILCLLLGGVEKTLPNGTRLRGDINLLLVGDPSVAKSQLLRYVLGCAPRAIPTTGRGSSGVGLTAAVTTDPETGDRRLEAGAMVLADRGIVCVDEFDKMSDIDRTAIHEVMEQGRVTICKAGIQARLNARCSVLAAANPICGNYDPYKPPMENIGMQDSLLSRFDLTFIMLDEHDRVNDRTIVEHVANVHMYRSPNELDGEPSSITTGAHFLTTIHDQDGDEPTEMFEKYNPLLHGKTRDKYFTIEFLRKYIHIAKRVEPKLTEEACVLIGHHYSELRKLDCAVKDVAKTQPITARSLETMIRLATAHAKARLSTEVTRQDAKAAIELIQLCCYHKVLSRPKPRRKRKADKENLNDESSEFEDDETTMDSSSSLTRKKRKGAAEEDEPEPEKDQVSEVTPEQMDAYKSKLPDFQKLIISLSRENNGAEILDVDMIYSSAQDKLQFSKSDVDVLIALMHKNESAQLVDNFLYLT